MKRYTILWMLLICCLSAFSQDAIQGFIRYHVEHNDYHEMPNGKRERYHSKTFSATLYYKNKETLYKEITTEAFSENQSQLLSTGSVTRLPGNIDTVQSIVYKDDSQNVMYYSYSPVSGRLGIFLKDSLQTMQWETTLEEKEIKNRKCTKFILKSFFNTDWTAWVDLQIAFAEGPWRFHNLPGLIVELAAANDTQKYTLQEINMGTKIANESLYPNELNTVKVFDKSEYEKKEKDKRERIRLLLKENNRQTQQ